MSHKRPSKRSRTSTAEYTSYSSPSSDHFQPKRSRLDDESSVRRSSRAPKPKVFDDEFVDTLHSTFDDSQGTHGKKEKALSPTKDLSFDSQTSGHTSNVYDSDLSKRRKSGRAPKPNKSFDEDFVDSPKSKHDFRTSSKDSIPKSHGELDTFAHTSSKQQSKYKEQKRETSEKSKIKSNIHDRLHFDDFSEVKTPKGNQKRRKSSEKPNYYDQGYLQQPEQGQYFTDQPQTSSYYDDSPKVRQSSRTPKPKKMFSLIEDPAYASITNDSNDDANTSVCVILNEIGTPKISSKSSKKHSHIQSPNLVFPSVSLEPNKKKAKGKSESSSDEKLTKKSKKSKTDSDLLWNPAFAQYDYNVMGDQSEGKKGGKEKSKRSSSMGAKEGASVVDVSEESVSGESTQGKKKSKKKSQPKVEVIANPPVTEKAHLKPVEEHSKKSHSKHSKAKHDQPHSETKDEDQHIILKVHLPQSPSHHSHSHKKHHKHRHHSSESKEGSASETKTKKHRLPMDGGSLSVSSEETPKKKLSIKFKGLSSSDPDVEVDVETPFDSSSLEESIIEPGKKKKAKKRSQDVLTSPSIPLEEQTQEHVKVVIKKKKNVETPREKKSSEKPQEKQVKSKAKEPKLASSKTASKEKDSTVLTNPKSKATGSDVKTKSVVHRLDGKLKVTEGKSKTVPPEAKTKSAVSGAKSKTATSEEKSSKSSPKKKSKGGSTPGKSPEKKKSNISGYILFCKSERHHIAEANPGLDFPQVSQKVGEAWHSLSDLQKQRWKDKANAIKAKLNHDADKKKDNSKKHDTSKSPGPDSVDMAAHLKLLGESLALIGASLMSQRGTEVHGSLSVLLDSILCAICPLTFLTSHIPGIPGVSKEKQVDILDDLAYTMPGLG